ncbi:RHS repeat-associated core domain-containing protein [Streptomyces bacillaris]|uniref:hypothetical protein n=1 Tax=Streptomyces bacillaris TaxID=68179 RepID=UPI0013A68EDE
MGRFISVDPIIDFDDPAQMNAYSYAHNSPLTKSDPTGLRPDHTVGNAKGDERWASDRGMYAGCTLRNGKWVWKETPKRSTEAKKRYKAYKANPTTYMVNDSHAKKRSADIKAGAKKATDAAAAKRAKAAAEKQRKEDGIFGKIMKGRWGAAWGNSKSWVSSNWDNIQTGLTIVAFGVCVVASAGACIAVGAGIAAAKFRVNWGITGEADWSAFGKDLAWTAVGGGTAAAFGRAVGGASTWRSAYSSTAIARVPAATKMKVPGVRGVGGGKRSWTSATTPRSGVDWGATYGNTGVNAAFNVGFCGAGNASLGSYASGC